MEIKKTIVEYEVAQLQLENKWLHAEKVRLVALLAHQDERADQLIADIERQSALGEIK